MSKLTASDIDKMKKSLKAVRTGASSMTTLKRGPFQATPAYYVR